MEISEMPAPGAWNYERKIRRIINEPISRNEALKTYIALRTVLNDDVEAIRGLNEKWSWSPKDRNKNKLGVADIAVLKSIETFPAISERNKDIFVQYMNGLTFAEIGEIHKISSTRARDIFWLVLRRYRYLKNLLIYSPFLHSLMNNLI